MVIGGSLAGLLAARVLAGHAGRVTVIERDRLPEGPEHRPGVPQDRHLHVLLAAGEQALESLLPGFVRELEEHGGSGPACRATSFSGRCGRRGSRPDPRAGHLRS